MAAMPCTLLVQISQDPDIRMGHEISGCYKYVLNWSNMMMMIYYYLFRPWL
jgi:hypothetical protein